MNPELRKKMKDTLEYHAKNDDDAYPGSGFDILRWARKGYLDVRYSDAPMTRPGDTLHDC